MRVLKFWPVMLVVCGLWVPGLVLGQGEHAPLPAPNEEESGQPPIDEAQPACEFQVYPAEAEVLLEQFVAPNMAVSPRPFVHSRQTVRTSERMAEIWVSLPKDSQSSVAVNFVEHPPEGEFRIFRTKLNSQEPRRFYLSAKRWDVNTSRWIDLSGKRFDEEGHDLGDLGPCSPLPSKGSPTASYVDLQPGQRAIVHFDNDPGCQIAAAPPVPACDLDAALAKHLEQVTKLHEATQASLQATQNTLATQTGQLKAMTKTVGDIKDRETDLQNRIEQLELATAPHARSAKVTNQFRFDVAARKITGNSDTVNDRIKSIDWTQHPASVVIAAPKSVKAMPPRPFTADVTFSLRQGGEETFSETTISVEFSDLGNHIVGSIPFHQCLAGPLSNALVDGGLAPGTFHVSATIDYKLEQGELDPVWISGPLGNEIELTIEK